MSRDTIPRAPWLMRSGASRLRWSVVGALVLFATGASPDSGTASDAGAPAAPPHVKNADAPVSLQGDTMPWQRSGSVTLPARQAEATAFPAAPPDPSGPPRLTVVRYVSGLIRAPADQYVVPRCQGQYLVPVKVGEESNHRVVYVVSAPLYVRIPPGEKLYCSLLRVPAETRYPVALDDASFQFVASGYQVFVR